MKAHDPTLVAREWADRITKAEREEQLRARRHEFFQSRDWEPFSQYMNCDQFRKYVGKERDIITICFEHDEPTDIATVVMFGQKRRIQGWDEINAMPAEIETILTKREERSGVRN